LLADKAWVNIKKTCLAYMSHTRDQQHFADLKTWLALLHDRHQSTSEVIFHSV